MEDSSKMMYIFCFIILFAFASTYYIKHLQLHNRVKTWNLSCETLEYMDWGKFNWCPRNNVTQWKYGFCWPGWVDKKYIQQVDCICI